MKRENLTVRVLPSEKQVFQELADHENISISRWVVNAALRVAMGEINSVDATQELHTQFSFPANEAEESLLRAVFMILQILNETTPPDKRQTPRIVDSLSS